MSIKQNYDVVVLGAGILGAATAHQLTCSGLKTALLERGAPAQGCTAYSGGIVRIYHSNDYLTELAASSFKYYLDFEANTGVPASFTRTGYLYFPPVQDNTRVQEKVQQLRATVDIEWLDRQQMAEQFPTINCDEGAVYEPGAGYMAPAEVTRAFIRAATAKGATLYPGTEVYRLIRRGNKVVGVSTSQGTFTASHVVVALGPNTPAFLDKNNIPHSLWSQRIQVDIKNPRQAVAGHPAWIDDVNDLNGRPYENGQFLLGYPTHDRLFIDSVTPGSPVYSEVTSMMGQKRFSWVNEAEQCGSWSSFDCYSPAGIGAAEKIEGFISLSVLTGYSGGGFKLAPELARRITDNIIKE
ncbi:NAD(P)/FAD-dependent oxidoreductase [Erwinia pyrifoliae]|uniref:FAD-binding oxidoreductase n=1 Tax=Erwinia pyrifoliae TaxID=79967 RepID=A0ABY5X9Z8_ERWPY|nr:FAD-dependent oxidoreductase [Erwinia pyrifoliae]AUX73987.1 FAD-binding oxidoreductase [Erwinia pyrifoliae]MCA8875674.1 FAD-binding oxidoreductase [Erwinia pyrifoliae]MCT2385879.1 FAD-binding oxidoreductase [Erwinia pyrifoliae]MCU8588544.1 FAD-binding oxidoreductase [Erwinia pyrifoliae]UWS29717.1 FAD-binding oxidoreductase [Erwinia pyrifoliae]